MHFHIHVSDKFHSVPDAQVMEFAEYLVSNAEGHQEPDIYVSQFLVIEAIRFQNRNNNHTFGVFCFDGSYGEFIRGKWVVVPENNSILNLYDNLIGGLL